MKTMKTAEEIFQEIQNITLRSMILSGKVYIADEKITTNLTLVREGHLSEGELKKIWDETKSQILEVEKLKKEWIELQLRLIEADRDLRVLRGEENLH